MTGDDINEIWFSRCLEGFLSISITMNWFLQNQIEKIKCPYHRSCTTTKDIPDLAYIDGSQSDGIKPVWKCFNRFFWKESSMLVAQDLFSRNFAANNLGLSKAYQTAF